MDQITSIPNLPTEESIRRRRSKIQDKSLGSQRVFKKTSANSVLTLYLGSRELVSKHGIVEPLRGVVYIDPKFMYSQKIYGQLTLTFRYGREDEEVMGLKFCNEAVIAFKQIWPQVNYNEDDVTPLQEALVERLGEGAHPFTLEIAMIAPPSVQLIPAKKYNGAPIGTSYDIRVFMSDLTDDKFQRRTTVKLGIRLMHKIPCDPRAIEETNPVYTSLPKSIRLRLSPKQPKFHHKKHQQQPLALEGLNNQEQEQQIYDFGDPFKGLNLTPTHHFGGFKQRNINRPIGSPQPPSDTLPSMNGNNSEGTLTMTETANRNRVISGNVQTSTTISTERTETSSMPAINSAMDKTGSTDGKGPEGFVDKPFLWTEGRVCLKASLNKSAYGHEEKIYVTVNIKNNSRKVIRKIRIFAVQHVDVCMFSNGKFKNVVAEISENHQIKPNDAYNSCYEVIPIQGPTKNWIAVEGSYMNHNEITTNLAVDTAAATTTKSYKIASSAHRSLTAEERNVFAIYVSYYVKVKLTLGGMGGEVSLKLPFVLGHLEDIDHDNDDGGADDELPISENNQTNTLHKPNVFNVASNSMKASSHKQNICDVGVAAKTTNRKDDIIEEVVVMHETHDSISSHDEGVDLKSNNDSIVDDDIQRRNKIKEEKFSQDRDLLQRYKLKRESYSKSCEDIESLSTHEEGNVTVGVSAVRADVHRQANECND